MARKHHRDSPVVKDFENLYLRDHPDMEPIPLETSQWYAWLEVADMFSLVTDDKDFTVRKERRNNNDFYWYLCGRDGSNKTVKKYLGKSPSLTKEKLLQASKKFYEPKKP